MKDSPHALPEALAALAREEQRALEAGHGELGAELERLTLGQLSAEERRALERKAMSDERLASALLVHAPLPALFQERLLETARSQLRPPAPPPGRLDEAPRPQAPARRGPWRRTVGLTALTFAAAAGVGLFVLRGAPPATLPGFDVSFAGGEAQLRGESPPSGRSLRLRPDGEIDLILRPEEEIRGRLEVSAEVFPRDGAARRLGRPPEVSAVGAVRIAGRVQELFPGLRGPMTLLILLRTPGAQSPVLTATNEPDAGPGWRRLKLALEIDPSNPDRR